MVDDKIVTSSDLQGEFDRSRLLLAMTHTLSLEELRTVCFELGIEYDDLPPGGRTDKTRELILFCERHGRIDDLLNLLKRKRPNTDWENVYRPWASGDSPFKGLSHYDVADAYLYFGREVLTAELTEDIRHNRFLAVVGASGSGKSSLVRAGLVPTLQGVRPPEEGVRLPDGSSTWPVHIITPTARPLESLAISLTQDSESLTATETLINDLSQNPRSLHLYARKLLADGDHGGESGNSTSRLLLIIDQFEELFTQCQTEEVRQAFIANLMTAIDPELDGPVKVIIILRADFYSHCAQYDDLRLALEKKQRYIGQMSADELQRAIEEPARVQNITFEAELVHQMLRDIGAEGDKRPEPGALPLLSHALLETWKRREGNQLTLAGYYNSGGVRGAIAQTANNTYFSLPPEQQLIARNVFLRLTDLGENTEDTRRRASFEELLIRDSEADQVTEVLHILANARLITTSENDTEVAHESLIREWPALRNWLNEDREGLLLHRKLTEDAIEWQENDRDPSFLYQGARLAAVEDWMADTEEVLSEIEASFFDACQAKKEEQLAELQAQAEAERNRADREARRSKIARLVSVVLLGLLLLAAAAFVTAYSRQQVVNAQRLAFASKSQIDISPETALLLAAEAALRVPDFQSEQALRDSLDAYTLRPVPLAGHEDRVYSAALSPNGQQALTGSKDGTARLWGVDGRPLIVFEGHKDEINSALFDAGGDRVLTASADGTARLWNMEGEPIAVYDGHDDGVRSAIFGPDEQLVVTSSDDETARLWDTEGALLQVFEGHEDKVVSADMSPDGQLVLTASEDGTVWLWDLEGNPLTMIDAHEEELNNALFSPDGQQVLTSGDDGAARLWELDGNLVTEFEHSNMKGAIFMPDGQHVVTIGGSDNVAQLWDMAGQPITEFHGHTNTLRHVAASPDGQSFLTASSDGTARLWDLEGRSLAVFRGHAGVVTTANFSPDGSRIVTASYDNTARIWEHIGPHLPIIGGYEDDIESIEFSPDGTLLLIASDDGTARLLDTNGNELVKFLGHENQVENATFSPDGQKVLTASDDATARLWDLNGQQLALFEGHEDEVKSASFSPDGQRVLTGSNDGTARLWDLGGKQLVIFEGHEDEISHSQISPDGQRVLTASDDRTARLWDLEGNTIAIMEGHEGQIEGAAFSPDGQTVATWSGDFTARMWDMNGQPLAILEGHETQIENAAFSPDGRHFITAAEDRPVRLWDLEGNTLALFKGHKDAIEMARFSPDSQFVLTNSRDGTARLWNLEGEEVAILRGHNDWVETTAFSPDGRLIATGSRDDTVRLRYTRLEDLLAVATCRVGRGLTEQEIDQFGVGRPRYRFEERNC